MKDDELKDLLYKMIYLRRFEEKAGEMYTMGKFRGFCHLYIGEEAVAVGALSTIRDDDYVLASYREHAHCLIKGSDGGRVMAELFGKERGVSKGKGGSMHLFDIEKNFWGGHAIVAGHLPLATGMGFAIKYEGKDQVVLCFFGEGSVNQGTFHESLNLASVWKLPVIYCIENNRYGMGTAVERATSLYDICQKACAYDIPNIHIDGMDVLNVKKAFEEAVKKAREEKAPTLIEAVTYRFRGHSMADPAHYRTKEELEEQKKRDPVETFKKKLMQKKVISEKDVKDIEKEIEEKINQAVEFADKSPEPPLDSLYEDLYIE
jgi:pyruvate dehydrogenase E1 component alpha subunit